MTNFIPGPIDLLCGGVEPIQLFENILRLPGDDGERIVDFVARAGSQLSQGVEFLRP